MTLTVYCANVQHGQGTDEAFDFSRQITALTGAELIAVSERSGSETGWDAPMSSAGLSQAIYRANQIGGSDGNAIWYKGSKVTILKTYEQQLSIGATSPWDGIPTNVDKSAVAVKARAEGEEFYFVATHLAQAAGADSDGSLFSSIRVGQIQTLLNWINSELVGFDVLIVGDMNLGPNYLKSPEGFQLSLFEAAGFTDLWRQGMTQNKATASWGDRNTDSQPDMPVDDLLTRTHDTRRIDYCLLKRVNGALLLNAIDLPDNRATCPHGLVAGGAFPACTPEVTQLWDTPDDFGVRPSDHNWIKLTLDINPNAPTPVIPSQFSWFPNVNL